MDIHRCFSARKRKQVRRACLNCQKAHSGCGEQRPCPRCVKRKEEHKCIDAPRRKKKEDFPLDEGVDSDEYSSQETEPIHINKRKRKLSDVSSSPSSPSTSLKAEKLSPGHHSDDDCCSTANNKSPRHHKISHQQPLPQPQHSALVVRTNKRPRRNKWPAGSAFFSPTNTLAFPTSPEAKPQATLPYQQPHQPQQPQQHNSNKNTSFGQVLSQKLSLLEQPPARPQYIINKKELEDSPFLFNPQEFDCVVPTEIQPPLTQQQQQHTQTPRMEDLSLEWVLPDLCLWGSTTTTTTTTTSTIPGHWGYPEQQISPASLYLGTDDNPGYGVEDFISHETPYFTDYRTFEPLFSF